MTDLSLELMDITFCDALPGLYCSWLQLLFFVGLSALSFVLSKWNACSVGLKSGNWLGHCRIFHLLPSKSPGLFLLYVLGHCPLVIWSAIQSTLLHLTESGQRVYISQYTSELIRLLLSSVTLSLNTSNPVPLEAMHAHSIIHHVSQMMLCALHRELFQAFFFLSFWYRFNSFLPSKECFPEVVWLC